MQGPDPGDRPKGHFQTAWPVDATSRRVRIEPIHKLGDEGLRVALVLRQQVGLTHRHEMAVAIELPRYLLLAGDGRIEIPDRTPMGIARALARQGFQMPLDRVAE